jgi:outer membrane protein
MKFTKFIKSAAIIAVASFAMANSALAQSTILVVDQARVIRESAVGQHVKRQIESIATQMQKEIKAQNSPLESELTRLQADTKGMTSETLQSRPDILKRAQDFQIKGQKSQQEAAYKKRELQLTEQKAIQKVNEELESILEALVKERNADVILDRTLVIYGGKSADVTETVISRLNGKIQTVSVVRVRLPRKAAGK